MDLSKILPTRNGVPYVNQRKGGRITNVPAACSHGRIMDLSGRGVRLRNPSRMPAVGKLVRFDLAASCGVFQIVGRVAWKRRIGLVHTEVGIEFIEMTPEAQQGLSTIVRDALGGMATRARERA